MKDPRISKFSWGSTPPNSAIATLLLLIFAGLNFRDFQKIAKLKTREKRFSRKLNTRNLISCLNSLINVTVSLLHI